MDCGFGEGAGNAEDEAFAVAAAGADAMEIHAEENGFEGVVTAAALLQKGGAERDITAANLGRGEVEATHEGVETAWFEAVGVAVTALNVALVGGCVDVTDSLEKHGGVYEKFGDFGDGVFEPFFEKDVD